MVDYFSYLLFGAMLNSRCKNNHLVVTKQFKCNLFFMNLTMSRLSKLVSHFEKNNFGSTLSQDKRVYLPFVCKITYFNGKDTFASESK